MSRFRRGSTPKFNDEIAESLIKLIRSGVGIEKSVAHCGISKDTFYRWLAAVEGRNSPAQLILFAEKVKAALNSARMDKHLGSNISKIDLSD